MKKIVTALSVLTPLVLTLPAMAQNEALPEKSEVQTLASVNPEPVVDDIPALKVFRDEAKADLYYMGRHHSVDVWMAIVEDGIMQIIYTTLDGKGVMMNGFLFDETAKMITGDVVNSFLDANQEIVSKYMTQKEGQETGMTPMAEAEKVAAEIQGNASPAEMFWNELGQSTFVEFGAADAPMSYVFVDPRCPHCKSYWKKIKSHVDAGKVRLRLVLLGVVGADSQPLAATILGAESPQKAWLDVVDGLLEVSDQVNPVNVSKIKDNVDLMNKWRIQSTPFSVYRGKDGKVKMLRGDIPDLDVFFDDLVK